MTVNHDSLWRILQHSYQLPEKLISIIRILHVDSFAAVMAYGQTSVRFPVTSGVRQDCVLATTLFSNESIHLAFDHHRQASRGIQEAYLLDGELVGNRRALILETLIADLEYADDMALIADTWSDITSMLDSHLMLQGAWSDYQLQEYQISSCSTSRQTGHHNLNPSTLFQEGNMSKWYQAFNTWVALFRMSVEWRRRLTPGSARHQQPSSLSLAFSGTSAECRIAANYAF